MEPSIRSIVNGPRYVPRPVSDRERRPGREFVLPEGEDGDEPEVVLEPAPRRDRSEIAVSRERLEDEAGQNIDVKG